MENTFQKFKKGGSVNESLIEFTPDIYEKEVKLLKLGILINEDDFIVINPVIKKCNTLSTAKIRLKKQIYKWIKTLDKEAEKQEDFIIEMVQWFKDCKDQFLIKKIGDEMIIDINSAPFKYSNGRGKAYIKDSTLIAFHYGHNSLNAPKDCDVFNAYTESNLLILE